MQADGIIRFELNGADVLTSSITGLDTGWHHAAATWDAASVHLHFDGAVVASGERKTVAIAPDADFRIGCFTGSNETGRLPGTVDEVMLFNRALSASEIAAYSQSKAPYGSTYNEGQVLPLSIFRPHPAIRKQAGLED